MVVGGVKLTRADGVDIVRSDHKLAANTFHMGEIAIGRHIENLHHMTARIGMVDDEKPLGAVIPFVETDSVRLEVFRNIWRHINRRLGQIVQVKPLKRATDRCASAKRPPVIGGGVDEARIVIDGKVFRTNGGGHGLASADWVRPKRRKTD